MTPEARAEGLAAAARVLREEMVAKAELIAAAGPVEVVVAPAAGSVTLQVASPVGAFNLTEVAVTTAEARVAGCAGWGCVLGWDEEGALAAALLDATPGADVIALARRALEIEAAERDRQARAVATTRVGHGG
jgi:alpha-D-ribose 1-methylphosphonate 5-triphosphate synthase subunit PhnG